MKFLILPILICGFGCQSQSFSKKAPVETAPIVVTPSPQPLPATPKARISLNWENTTAAHPERKDWSDALVSILRKDLAVYSTAQDIVEICPKWKSLDNDQKVRALGAFWVALAYYESSYNPKSSSVDVGTAKDRGSYSDGLFQMSGNDSSTRALAYTYENLLEPIPNIEVATYQMKRQIVKCGKILLPNKSECRYWATLLWGNKYSKIIEIKARVIKHAGECK